MSCTLRAGGGLGNSRPRGDCDLFPVGRVEGAGVDQLEKRKYGNFIIYFPFNFFLGGWGVGGVVFFFFLM